MVFSNILFVLLAVSYAIMTFRSPGSPLDYVLTVTI
jgi:hypothetical protein